MNSKNKIFLKEVHEDELTEEVMSWFADEELMKYYTNSKVAITKDKLVSAIKAGKENGNQFTYGIYILETDKLIGTVKIGPINFTHKTSDLATLIGDRNYLGKGLSSEAVRLGVELAFEKFDLRKLYSGMYESNIASIKSYRRAGWIIEGRLKGQFLVDNKSEDRILVGCYNPKYFDKQMINKIKQNENRYF